MVFTPNFPIRTHKHLITPEDAARSIRFSSGGDKVFRPNFLESILL